MKRTPAERLWALLDIGAPDACWPFKGFKDKGYGRFTVSPARSAQKAHRVAYELWVGPVPEGLDVCHSCDNRACCNPAHLWTGTRADNMRDAKQKGRTRGPNLLGERNPRSLLTDAVVRAIRSRLREGATQHTIAREFGICRSLVSHIKTGRLWAHVQETACPEANP